MRNHSIRGVLIWFAVAMAIPVLMVYGVKSFCSPAKVVRVEIGGQGYALPASLRPIFLGPNVKGLPSFSVRDADGRWAYCQTARDRPAKVTKFVLYADALKTIAGDRHDIDGVYLLSVGEQIRHYPSPTSLYPTSKTHGFTLVHVVGFDQISASPGEVRAGPISGFCAKDAPERGATYFGCKVTFLATSGSQIKIFFNGDEHPIEDWKRLFAAIDDYVATLETSP